MSIIRVGEEILVNTATASTQFNARVTTLTNGGFVVTWTDFSQGVGGTGGDTSLAAVKAQVFAAGGTPVGAEILVNSATANGQFNSQVTALSNGGFVVAWEDDSRGVGGAVGDTSGEAVKAQVFAASGTPVGTEIGVATFPVRPGRLRRNASSKPHATRAAGCVLTKQLLVSEMKRFALLAIWVCQSFRRLQLVLPWTICAGAN